MQEGNREATIVALHDFLLSSGGAVTTQDIVDNFLQKVSKNDVPVFRQMLKQLAVMDRDTKVWVLKDEFR